MMRSRNPTMSDVYPVVKSGSVGKRKNISDLKREQRLRPKASTSGQTDSASFRPPLLEGSADQENWSQQGPTPSCEYLDDGLSLEIGSGPSQTMHPFSPASLASRRPANPSSKRPPKPRLENSQSCSFRTIGDAANEKRQLTAPERKPFSVLNGVNQMLSRLPDLKPKSIEAKSGAPCDIPVLSKPGRRDGDQIRCADGLPPLDWSLKTSARFVSPTAFDWCLDTDAQGECSSLRSSAANDRPCSNNQTSTSGRGSADGAGFRSALHTWSHPESPLPPSILQTLQNWLQKPGQDAHFWTQREAVWQESLRSLYLMLRTKMCPVFYCRFPQYVAMFMGPGIAGHRDDECCAYITRSTRGMRDLFEDQGLNFTMPLHVPALEEVNEETTRDFEDFAKENPGKVQHEDPVAVVDKTPESLLFFQGAEAVHGLYDILINHRAMFPCSTLTDVPQLISSVPFANATLKAPKVITKKMQQADGSVGYSLELCGAICPPWIISRVCEALRHANVKGIDASFATDPLSHCLNVLPDEDCKTLQRAPARSDTLNNVAKVRGCLDEQEEVRWRRRYNLDIGVVRQLKLRNGEFVATLKCSVA